MAKKRKSKRGRRYTKTKITQILRFVKNHNSNHGRGGIAKAIEKFGCSSNGIRSWIATRQKSKTGAKRRQPNGDTYEARIKSLETINALEKQVNEGRSQLAREKIKLAGMLK